MDKVSAGFLLASCEHCKNFVTDVAVEGPKIVITTRQTLGEVCVAPHLMSKKKTGQQQKKTRGKSKKPNIQEGVGEGLAGCLSTFFRRQSQVRCTNRSRKKKEKKRKKTETHPRTDWNFFYNNVVS